MTDFLNDLQRIGLTALFNPTFLFLLILLFFLGRLVGWLTRGMNIWKFIALGYFAIFLFRPLQDAGLIIGGVFVLGVASMYMDLFRSIFGWAGSFSDIFYALRRPNVYRDIDRLEREIEELKRQLHDSQNGGSGATAQSSTQNQWRQQAKARAAKSNPSRSSNDGASSQRQTAGTGQASGSQKSKGRKGFAGEKEKDTGRRGGSYRGANARDWKARSTRTGTSQKSSTSGRAKASARAGHRSNQQQAGAKAKSSSSGSRSSAHQQNQQSSQQQGSSQNAGAQQQASGGMSPALRDRYLTILELAPGQNHSAQDIKAAWRKMAFKTHPDQGGSAAAFNAAFSAYKALR